MSWQVSRHPQSCFQRVETVTRNSRVSSPDICSKTLQLFGPDLQRGVFPLEPTMLSYQAKPAKLAPSASATVHKYRLCFSQKESWSLNCVFYVLRGAIRTFFWSLDKYENCCFETAPTNPLPVAARGANPGSSFMKTPIISRRLRFLPPTYTTGILIRSVEPDRSLLLQHCFQILGSN